MDDQLKKAFDFAQETVKQLITLATGVIALTITFLNEVNQSATAKAVLASAWGTYIFSIACGLATLMALGASLEPHESGVSRATPSTRGWKVRLPATAQILAFVAAIVLTATAGGFALSR